MKEKKLTPLMICHLVLLALLTLLSVLVIMSFLIGTLMSGASIPAGYRTSMILGIVLYLINIIALSAGFVYFQERYAKRTAAVYKVFMLLTAVSSALYAVTGVSGLIAAESTVGAAAVFFRAVMLMAVKIVLLLVLTFGKDLGKRKTWILFVVVLVLDIVYSLIWINPGDMALASITAVVSRLAMTGTIGLAIKGKYDDKDARGTT